VQERPGVEVKMITGDHAITAMAIGKELGIGDGEKSLTGKELEQMSDEEMRKVVGEYDIYARTSPEQNPRLKILFTQKRWQQTACAIQADRTTPNFCFN